MPFKFNPITEVFDIVDTNSVAGPVISLTPDVGGAQFPVAGNINLFGGPGVTTVGAGGTITINAVAAAFHWHTVTSATNVNQILIENAYVCVGGTTVTFLLPAAAAVGDTFIVTSVSALFEIQQNAFQTIYVGINPSTTGVFGGINGVTVTDHVEITCVVANTTFKATSAIGNINYF